MRSLLRFAIANLGRRKLRTAVTASGVAIGLAAVFSLVGFQRGYQGGLRDELDRLGAHLLVVPKGCPYDAASIALHGASWPCYLKSSYVSTVRETPHVSVAAPVFMSAVYDAATGAQTVYCGVQRDILDLKRMWRIDGRFPAAGELLIGAETARANGWRVGQEVYLPGVDRAKGTVSGILRPLQGADDLFIYMPLADAQRLFKKPAQITHILVRLDAPEQMENVVNALRGCGAGLDMNVVPLAHLFHTIQSLVQSTRVLLGSVALVALLAAAAGVSNTVLMSVTERTREIGVLRAVGVPRTTVFSLIWIETVVLCVNGGGAGIAGAIAGSRGIESWLRARLPFAPHGALVQWDALLVVSCLAGTVALGTLAALLPAGRAARLSPVDAIRMGGS